MSEKSAEQVMEKTVEPVVYNLNDGILPSMKAIPANGVTKFYDSESDKFLFEIDTEYGLGMCALAKRWYCLGLAEGRAEKVEAASVEKT